MCKSISCDVVIGNFIIEAVIRNRHEVSFNDLIIFNNQVNDSLKQLDYFTKFSINGIFEFEDDYPFFVASSNDNGLEIKVKPDKIPVIQMLERHFRSGLPNNVITEFITASNKILGN